MIKNLLQEGFTLKSKGHYKHAIEVFYKALEYDNTSSELLLEIADLYYLIGNEERALNYIEQILNQNPAHIESLKLLEKIFTKKNAFEEAEQTAKNIYCISHSVNDLVEIFKLLNQQGKFDEVFEYRFEESNSALELEIARAHYYKKDFKKAKEILEKALEVDSSNQDLLLLLAQTCYSMNEKDYCVSLLDRLVVDETNPETLNFAGLVETYRGNYKCATEYFNCAIRISGSNSEYYYNLANVYFKQGETLLAKKYYNMAISISPENKNYHFALANLYYSEKHYKRALEELKGNFFEARLLKAVILYDTGYLALAKKELEKLAQERPENNIIKDYRARIDEELRIN